MTDISIVLPDFQTAAFAHLIAPLERAGITTAELLCVQPADVARKAQIPPSGAAKLITAVVEALHGQVEETVLPEWQTVSFLDPVLDQAWNGGAPTRHITEITGESGVGKTQFLLTLLLSVQLPAPQGLGKSALYISTEAALSTSRLSQILDSHPQLCNLPEVGKPTLANIHAIQVPDLEAQDHILRYQVPVAINRFNVGLLVIDSIASNYRAEMDVLPLKNSHANALTSTSTPTTAAATSAASGRTTSASSTHILAERRAHLIKLGSLLRDLAHTHNIAIVVSNQVADRFGNLNQQHNNSNYNTNFLHNPPSNLAASSAPQYGPPGTHNGAVSTTTTDPLTLDHQQRWITGWGDRPHDLVLNGSGGMSIGGLGPTNNDKTPALGLAWSNQIAARVALVKESSSSSSFAISINHSNLNSGGGGGGSTDDGVKAGARRRWMRVVFGSWMPQTSGRGIEYEIVGAGVRAVVAPAAEPLIDKKG